MPSHARHLPAPQVNRTKWCNRFYPVEQTCYASMDKIEELAAAVAAQHFPADAAEGIEVGGWAGKWLAQPPSTSEDSDWHLRA